MNDKFITTLNESANKIADCAKKALANDPTLGVIKLRDLVSDETKEDSMFVYQLLTRWIKANGMVSNKGRKGGITKIEAA